MLHFFRLGIQLFRSGSGFLGAGRVLLNRPVHFTDRGIDLIHAGRLFSGCSGNFRDKLGRFNRGIQRQKIGLKGDFVDRFDDFLGFFTGSGNIDHGFRQLLPQKSLSAIRTGKPDILKCYGLIPGLTPVKTIRNKFCFPGKGQGCYLLSHSRLRRRSQDLFGSLVPSQYRAGIREADQNRADSGHQGRHFLMGLCQGDFRLLSGGDVHHDADNAGNLTIGIEISGFADHHVFETFVCKGNGDFIGFVTGLTNQLTVDFMKCRGLITGKHVKNRFADQSAARYAKTGFKGTVASGIPVLGIPEENGIGNGIDQGLHEIELIPVMIGGPVTDLLGGFQFFDQIFQFVCPFPDGFFQLGLIGFLFLRQFPFFQCIHHRDHDLTDFKGFDDIAIHTQFQNISGLVRVHDGRDHHDSRIRTALTDVPDQIQE